MWLTQNLKNRSQEYRLLEFTSHTVKKDLDMSKQEGNIQPSFGVNFILQFTNFFFAVLHKESPFSVIDLWEKGAHPPPFSSQIYIQGITGICMYE